MIQLIYDAHSFQRATATHAHGATPLSFDVSFIENPCEFRHKLYIARNYRVPELYMRVAMLLVYLYLLLRN